MYFYDVTQATFKRFATGKDNHLLYFFHDERLFLKSTFKVYFCNSITVTRNFDFRIFFYQIYIWYNCIEIMIFWIGVSKDNLAHCYKQNISIIMFYFLKIQIKKLFLYLIWRKNTRLYYILYGCWKLASFLHFISIFFYTPIYTMQMLKIIWFLTATRVTIG